MTIAPWHMWGNTQVLETQQTGGTGVASTAGTQQLVRVNYGRPETWHFVFQSVLLEAPSPTIPGQDISVDVFFDLTIGIGRSIIQLDGFEHHQWAYNSPNAAPLGTVLTTTSVKGNRLLQIIGGGPTITTDPTLIDEITSQDIQLQARLILTTTGNGFTARAQCSAHFAPKNHIRPEWFLEHFPGHEEKGH